MSFSETVFLFLLALLVFGPKKLPEIARQIGKALNEFRRASNEFKAQIEAEVSQLEFEERDRKRREEDQKLLQAAEPPPGTIEASTAPSTAEFPSEQKPSPEHEPPATELNTSPEQTTHA